MTVKCSFELSCLDFLYVRCFMVDGLMSCEMKEWTDFVHETVTSTSDSLMYKVSPL